MPMIKNDYSINTLKQFQIKISSKQNLQFMEPLKTYSNVVSCKPLSIGPCILGYSEQMIYLVSVIFLSRFMDHFYAGFQFQFTLFADKFRKLDRFRFQVIRFFVYFVLFVL